MAWLAPVSTGATVPDAGLIHRHAEPDDPLGGSAIAPGVGAVLARRRGRGEPLPEDVARSMGDAIGANLDEVRIHTGREPAELARSVQAAAFTQGADIYFGAGRYAPQTPAGQHLLAHELAHTVQASKAGGSGAGSVIGRAADPAEADADRVADRVLRVLRRQSAEDPDHGGSPATHADHVADGVLAVLRRQLAGEPGAGAPLTSVDATAAGVPRVTDSSLRALRKATPGRAAGSKNDRFTVSNTAFPSAGPTIRRFYAVVAQPQKGKKYERVNDIPYEWITDAWDADLWELHPVQPGWRLYSLYRRKKTPSGKKTATAQEKKSSEGTTKSVTPEAKKVAIPEKIPENQAPSSATPKENKKKKKGKGALITAEADGKPGEVQDNVEPEAKVTPSRPDVKSTPTSEPEPEIVASELESKATPVSEPEFKQVSATEVKDSPRATAPVDEGKTAVVEVGNTKEKSAEGKNEKPSVDQGGPAEAVQDGKEVGTAVKNDKPVIDKSSLPLHVSAGPREQLFGNERYSYQVLTDDPEAADRIRLAFQSFKQESAKRKNDSVTKVFEGDHFKEPVGVLSDELKKERQKLRSGAVMGKYPKALKLGPVADRIQASPAFSGAYELRSDLKNPKRKLLFDKGGPDVVAVLLLGDAEAFKSTDAVEGKRKVVSKTHAEGDEPTHVHDDAGVPTRRFAYFETSRHQLMAALGNPDEEKLPPALRGRYARHRQAMNVSAKLNEIDPNDPDLAAIWGVKPGEISLELMANIHQYLGSGLNQRGLSLTSTPKKQVYSNDGDSFKSNDGVRIKVDLSLVPPDVILLNHYAEEGVGARLAQKPEFPQRMIVKPKPTPEEKKVERAEARRRKKADLPPAKRDRSYNYAASVVKNRELFLQELRPEWIVEVVDHLKEKLATPQAPVQGPASKTSQPTDKMREALGHAHYATGRAEALKGIASTESSRVDAFAKTSYTMGYGAGAEEAKGKVAAPIDIAAFWGGFKDVHDKKPLPRGKAGPNGRDFGIHFAQEISDVDQRAKILAARHPWYVLTCLRREVDGVKMHKDMHDTFWLGWAEAAKLPTATPVEKPAEIKSKTADTPTVRAVTDSKGVGKPTPSAVSGIAKNDAK